MKTNSSTFILRVSYSWAAAPSIVNLTQFLGNGHIEPDGSLSTCARRVSRLHVGQPYVHSCAFGEKIIYTRVS